MEQYTSWMKLALAENPTLETLVKVQTVLEEAEAPLSRYEIHKRVGRAVNYPVIESILAYLAEMRLVVDEGKGGKVLWVHNVHAKARSLFARSRRVA